MRAIGRWFWRWTRRLAYALVALVLIVIAVRVVDSQTGPALQPWHTEAPDEPRAEQLHRMDWAGWMAAEQRVFEQVAREVTARIPPEARVPENRFHAGSPIHAPRFAQDWNRSFVLEPEGPPRGAVVLLHGLTDAPYSLRHFAELYRAAGFVALGLRVPGHGTVPAGLTQAIWEDWSAATRMAMREARRRAGPHGAVHIMGYSNGGALALKHAMDAVEDQALVRPDRVVVISPMVGVSGFARFAGLAGLPALLPRFAKAAWLSVLPEFNPFKYNSFPVNAAVQSFRLTQAVQGQVRRLSRANLLQGGSLDGMAPVLAFQSLMDFTVRTDALVQDFFAHLPANGSELVIFDRNRGTQLGFLLRPVFDPAVESFTPDPPRNWRLTIITNRDALSTEVVARITPAGATEEQVVPLGLHYPRDVYSLSHIALPFPENDSLYGLRPDQPAEFGVSLGAAAIRGETGVLVMALDSLVRISWNPFFSYMAGRITEALAPR